MNLSRYVRRVSKRAARLVLVAFVCLGLGSVGASAADSKTAGDKQALPQKPAELFNDTGVWTVHLKFTPQEWEGMEPKGGGFGPFGGPRPGGPGGPAGPGGGRGPGGPGGFGPGMFLAPAFINLADQDKDKKLSKEEFRGLAEKWFAQWDKEKAGKLSGDQLRDGLNVVLAPPPNQGPGGGPGAGPGGPGGAGGPGGPGAPGGRPPGIMLQGPEGKRNGLASAAGIEFNYVKADLEFEGQLLKDVAVRYKGNGTWMQSQGSPKRSMKLDLNRFVKGQKIAGQTQLNLHNCVTDASWMNEVLSHRLFRDAGVPAARTAYARVYVTVPGKHDRQYLGLYSLVEDVGKPLAEERFGATGGAIFKPVTPNLFADLGDDWSKYNQSYDPKNDLSEQQKRRVIEFARLVTKADDAEFAAKLGEYVDLDNFSRFMAVTVWLSTMDSILMVGQNYYVYLHPQTNKFHFMPWDLDHSFGQFFMAGSQEQREKLSIHRPWRGDNRFLDRVYKVEAFKKLYLARLEEFSKGLFAPERFHQQVDETAAAIRPAVREESEAKLEKFDKAVAGQPVEPAGFGPPPTTQPRPGQGGPPGGGGFRGFGFMQPVKPIKAFVTARAQSVLDQVAGKSKGETLEGFGFGPPGGPGGRGGPATRPGGPGGSPGGFGPGMFLGPLFMAAMDADRDEKLTRDEVLGGFDKWFASWNTDKSGLLTEEQLRNGMNQDMSPFRGG